MISHYLCVTRVFVIGPRYRIICIITQQILAPLYLAFIPTLPPSHTRATSVGGGTALAFVTTPAAALLLSGKQ